MLRIRLAGVLLIVATALPDANSVKKNTRQPVLIPLSRRPGEVMYGTETAMRSHFVAQLRIGVASKPETLQEMDVVFDTSSGQVIVPSTACNDQACQDRNLYSYEVTGGTVVKDSPYGAEPVTELDMVDFDSGVVSGFLTRDSFCFGPSMDFSGKSVETCMEMNLLAARHMADQPFMQLPFDGVVGLGMNPLSISPLFNFISAWSAADGSFARQFAVFFPPDRSGPGELAFGGHVTSRLAKPLVWLDVEQPELGFWLLKLKAVTVGGQSMDSSCKTGCYGLIDTGSSRLGVPEDIYAKMNTAMKLETPKNRECRQATGPELRISFAGVDDELVFSGGDYGSLVGDSCISELVKLRQMPLDNVYVFGETVLRKYYTVFDWEKNRVGFGLAKDSSKAKDEL